MWRSLAAFACECQTDEFTLNRVPKILREEQVGSNVPEAFESKRDAFDKLVETFEGIENHRQFNTLRKRLTDSNFRARRCTAEGAQEIFEGIIRRPTKEHAQSWGVRIRDIFNELALNPRKVHSAHLHVSGDREQGKSSAYPLALHICFYGYAPLPDLHDNSMLKELQASVHVDPKWTEDCKNEGTNFGIPFCNYGYVSVILLEFLYVSYSRGVFVFSQLKAYGMNVGAGNAPNLFRTKLAHTFKKKTTEAPLVVFRHIDEACNFEKNSHRESIFK